MPLWILFFTALTLVEVVLTEPVFRRSGQSHRPLGGTSPRRPSATQKNPPPAGKPGQGGGFGFL